MALQDVISLIQRITCDYARVSEDDGGAAQGVDSQRGENRDFGEEIGRPISESYIDNSISAFSGRERPEYQRLRRDIARGKIEAVIVWHADRLTRDVREALDLIDLCLKHDVRLFSVQKGGEYLLKRAIGRAEFIADINSAQKESGHKGERIALARKRQARTGTFGGGIRPYGWGAPTGRVRSKCINPKAPLAEREYRDVPVLDVSKHRPEEAAEIRRWATELLATKGRVNQIIKDLNQRGVPTVSQTDGRQLRYRGKAVQHHGWEGATVVNIVTGPRVSGHQTYRGEIMTWGAYEPIIPEETRQALITLLLDPARTTTPGPAPKWLVSMTARCGYCETGKARVNYRAKGPVYRCTVCQKGNQIAPLVDEHIADVAIERLSRADLVDLITPGRPDIDLTALRAEMATLEKRKIEAAKSFATGKIDMAMLETAKATVDQRIDEIRGEMRAGAAVSPLADFLEADTPGAARKVWNALTIGRRREIVRLLMDITLMKGPTYELDPATVLITPKGRPAPAVGEG
ncbi:recombinase family protein [Streptomyces liliifuscus]|uniref:Recombinase family protein n=1 Tax=Streptomyces liliifuscus TaxID=2797636 RepID=A0A7T7RFQ0_9ACTN|nr:recombinase family protein [Streptomyces liliifuscus]QQM44968.1 recombinase family protein [Streptomyces liliifuscus]